MRSCCLTLSTGLLCLHDGVHPPHLEGEEWVIDALFASIGRDGRREFASGPMNALRLLRVSSWLAAISLAADKIVDADQAPGGGAGDRAFEGRSPDEPLLAQRCDRRCAACAQLRVGHNLRWLMWAVLRLGLKGFLLAFALVRWLASLAVRYVGSVPHTAQAAMAPI